MRVFGIPGIAHRRRQLVAATAVGIAVILAGFLQMFAAFASGNPSRPVDRDLDSYVLFAFDTLSFKGAESPGRGEIHGGDVGAGGVDATPNDSSPVLNICANDSVTMDDDTQVVADTMRITGSCSVWDMFTNQLVGTSDVVPRHSGPNAFSTPLLNSPPPFPSFTCDAGNPVDVDKDTSANLGAGSYGEVTLKDGSITTFGPGIYNLCSLHVGRDAIVNVPAGAELRITETFSIGNGTTFGSDCSVPVYVRADGATGANDVAINFAKQAVVRGHFLSLLGHLALGDDTDLFGQFVAHTISSDKNVNVSGCGGTPTTTTTTTSSSTSSTSTSSSTSSTSTSSSTTTSTSTSTSTTTTTVPTTSTSSTSTSTSSSSTSTFTSTTTTTLEVGATSTTTSSSSTSSTSTTSTSTTAPTTTSTSTSPSTSTSSTTTTVPFIPPRSTTTVPRTVTTAGGTTTSSVLGTTLTPTVTTSPVTPLGSTTRQGPLPFTGGSDWPLGLGLAALVLGGALLLVTQRR